MRLRKLLKSSNADISEGHDKANLGPKSLGLGAGVVGKDTSTSKDALRGSEEMEEHEKIWGKTQIFSSAQEEDNYDQITKYPFRILRPILFITGRTGSEVE